MGILPLGPGQDMGILRWNQVDGGFRKHAIDVWYGRRCAAGRCHTGYEKGQFFRTDGFIDAARLSYF